MIMVSKIKLSTVIFALFQNTNLNSSEKTEGETLNLILTAIFEPKVNFTLLLPTKTLWKIDDSIFKSRMKI